MAERPNIDAILDALGIGKGKKKGGVGAAPQPLPFSQTEAGESLAANLRFKLAGQRQNIDFAIQQQQEQHDVELLRKQFLQEKELEQKALTQARSKLFVDTIGRDIGASILFALTGKI